MFHTTLAMFQLSVAMVHTTLAMFHLCVAMFGITLAMFQPSVVLFHVTLAMFHLSVAMFHQRDCLVQQLENQEFFQLECQEKLAILRGLCLRVMATYSVQDYMEEKQREAIQLTYVLPQGLGVE